MKKIIFLTALLFCSPSIFAQILPNYKERALISLTDSLAAVNPNTLITATEGSVDADEYIVGPGDKIFISISGAEEDYLSAVYKSGRLSYMYQKWVVLISEKLL